VGTFFLLQLSDSAKKSDKYDIEHHGNRISREREKELLQLWIDASRKRSEHRKRWKVGRVGREKQRDRVSTIDTIDKGAKISEDEEL